MNEAKHTPWPWAIHPKTPMAVHQPEFKCWIPQNKANASLIAAAPELLDALEQCRLALEPYDDVKPRDWKTDREKLAFAHQAARAAIAKATDTKS